MKKLSIIALFASAMMSCNKLNLQILTPKCVVNKIKEFNTPFTCNNAKVDEYCFQRSIVYAFDPGSCAADMTTEVVNTDCNNLGYLGGFAGNSKINGVDFSTAIFIKTIWKK